MPKTTGKNIKQPIVTCRIVPGKTTPAIKATWRKWWQHTIGECKRELEADEREDKRGL